MRRFLPLAVSVGLFGSGCATDSDVKPVQATALPPAYHHVVAARPQPVLDQAKVTETKPSTDIVQVQAAESPKLEVPPTVAETPATSETTAIRVRPAYAKLETLPIDLPTVIRLVDENSPSVGFARARVREAEARLQGAKLQWLPNFALGVNYTRFDGQTQNQRGEVFGVSRSNLYGSGGPALLLDSAEAIYRPLVERRATAAEQYQSRSVMIGAEFDAVSAYLDLTQAYAQLEINKETLAMAEAMLTAAKNAKAANLDRTAGDVNRAQTEALFRQTERLDLEARVGIASARLGKLLLLQPNVKLVPGDSVIAPLTLVDPEKSLDDLVAQALANRPDLAAGREAIAAAWMRVRRQEVGPLLPKMILTNQVGGFGGGVNADVSNFSARNALNLQMYWELRNLGLGNRADRNERRAQWDQSRYRLADTQARALAEIVETAQITAAKYESLDLAERAVKEATELYRITKEGTFNVIDAKNLFDALRPLQAIQLMNQAQLSYLSAVIEFNRAQYRLLALVGQSPTIQNPR